MVQEAQNGNIISGLIMPPDEVKPLLSFTSVIHKTNTKQTFSDCEGSDQDPWAYNWLVCTGILSSFFGNPSNLGILGWHQFRIPTLMFKSSVQKESLWYWLWLSPQLFQAIVSPHLADQCLPKPILFSIWALGLHLTPTFFNCLSGPWI